MTIDTSVLNHLYAALPTLPPEEFWTYFDAHLKDLPFGYQLVFIATWDYRKRPETVFAGERFNEWATKHIKLLESLPNLSPGFANVDPNSYPAEWWKA
jgi:hypothetical protein